MARNKPSIKRLESYLQDIDDFDEPKVELEQYATPAHIAAIILNTIDLTYDDLEDKFVADLGCGTGRLSIGSLMCGARMVIGFDIDSEALASGLKNVIETFGEDSEGDSTQPGAAYRGNGCFNFVQADVASPDNDAFWSVFDNKFDTVLMNPPFGTKQNPGLDMIFLRRAIEMADNVVYSLHKTSTRDHILKRCQQWGAKGKPVGQIKYNLESTYKFHKRKSVDIDVDLWRVVRKDS